MRLARFQVSRCGLIAAFNVAAIGTACAQPPRIRPSQPGAVEQSIGATRIRIVYNRPLARGRTLFGDVVKWGRVWTPGADSATLISFSTAVTVNGEKLAAGEYSLWMEPQEQEDWTVIFSKATHVFHIPYPSGQDVLRLRAKPRTGSMMETLAFYFPVVDGASAELDLHWGTIIVPLSIVGATP
jgi:hypothetical protein